MKTQALLLAALLAVHIVVGRRSRNRRDPE